MAMNVAVFSAAIRKLMEERGLSYEDAAAIVRESTAKASVLPEAASYLPGQEPQWVSAMSGAESLADGLAGAPDTEITPEPQARDLPKQVPPEVMTQADIDYVNSLPQNSPEARAARAKRQAEADLSMERFENRLREQTGAAQSEAEMAMLRNGGVPPSFDPGSLGDDERLPSVSSARPQSYSNPNTFDPNQTSNPRQSFRDFERAEDMRRRGAGVPVEAQRERDFASGQYGDFDERLADQSRFARAAQFDPNGEFGPNDFQRRYNPQATAEWNQRMQEKIRQQARSDMAKYEAMQESDRATPLASSQFSDTVTNLFEAKAERADLERRVKNYARQNGLSYDDALSALQAEPNSPFLALNKTLPGDRYSGLERKSGQRKRLAAQVDRRDEQALRRERIATRHLLGISQPQANAFLMLSPEDRNRAVNYITNPMAARIDLASAQREGPQFDPLQQNAMTMQQNAAYSSGYTNAEKRDPNEGAWLWENKPGDAREWEDLREEIVGNEAPGSPGYTGAMAYFNQKYGASPPAEAGPQSKPSSSRSPGLRGRNRR